MSRREPAGTVTNAWLPPSALCSESGAPAAVTLGPVPLGPGPTTFPYQATVGGLSPGTGYYGVIRAFDTSPAANEEKNQVMQAAMPH